MCSRIPPLSNHPIRRTLRVSRILIALLFGSLTWTSFGESPPTVPITVRIIVKPYDDGAFVPAALRMSLPEGRQIVYTFDDKPAIPSEFLAALKKKRHDFGDHIPFRVIISEDVPLGFILPFGQIVKDSGLKGEFRFFLLLSKDGIRDGDALHEITITPFPVYTAKVAPNGSH